MAHRVEALEEKLRRLGASLRTWAKARAERGKSVPKAIDRSQQQNSNDSEQQACAIKHHVRWRDVRGDETRSTRRNPGEHVDARQKLSKAARRQQSYSSVSLVHLTQQRNQTTAALAATNTAPPASPSPWGWGPGSRLSAAFRTSRTLPEPAKQQHQWKHRRKHRRKHRGPRHVRGRTTTGVRCGMELCHLCLMRTVVWACCVGWLCSRVYNSTYSRNDFLSQPGRK